jgi:hypothetical protein
MRCSICDYSQSAPSIYSQGLSNAGHPRRVVSSKDHGYICTDCLDAITSTSYYTPEEQEFEDVSDLPDEPFEYPSNSKADLESD